MSKYYGESERLLGQVFSLANELSTGAIIFLDEVKGLVIARSSAVFFFLFFFSNENQFIFYFCYYLQFTYFLDCTIYDFPLFLFQLQVDSFAIARDSEMHEATRRVLSVLLRQVKTNLT